MDLYGIIGQPLSHSFSKDYFTIKFRMEEIDAKFQLFPIQDVTEIKDLIKEHPELKGLSVTKPYKKAVMPFLDEIDEEASEIGSVNVIRISRNGSAPFLKGYNTDAPGFENALVEFLPDMNYKALVLGNGGAAQAIKYALAKLGIDFKIVSRNQQNGTIAYDQLDEKIISERNLIINCTPLGMFPNENEDPALPYQFIGDEHCLYDLIYNPEETQFLKNGYEQGAAIENGLKMFYGQADSAWRVYRS